MDLIRKIVPEPVRDLTPVVLAAAGGFYLITQAGSCVLAHINKNRILNKWKDTPKDVVVLHTHNRGKMAPHNSPFVVKLETYLRMANIPHQVDNESMQSGYHPETGKTPWITLNGQHYADSQVIVEMLANKFNKKIGNYTDTERALGTAMRVLLDDHFYWGLLLWRYVQDGEGQNLDKLFDFSPALLRRFRKAAYKSVKANAWGQGLGRLDRDEIFDLMAKDLRTLSLLLGNKQFILGDEPSEDDCAVFGELVQVLWCMPGSPYEKLVKEELRNLQDYTLRMKQIFWPDWDECIGTRSTH